MQIQAIGSNLVDPTTSVSTNEQLSQNDFIKLFLSQLTFQDPLEPVDNSQFLAQLAQFSSVEQNRALNQKVDNLLAISTTFQAASLVGKTVDVNTNSGSSSGIVKLVKFTQDGPLLTLDVGNSNYLEGVELSQISKISS